jgi:FHS family glucose/mannose:H+ symporter-like MFS transporter
MRHRRADQSKGKFVTDQPGFLSRLFISGSLAFILIGIVGSLYGVALPAFTRAYGLAEGQAGLILTTHALGAIAAVLAATLGVPGLGGRTATALIATGAAAIAVMPGWTPTLAASCIIGAGFGLIATEVNRSFLAGFGSRGPGMVGLVNGISGAGLIAGPLLYVWTGGSVTILYGGLALLSAILIFTFDRAEAAPTPGRVSTLRTWRAGILLLNHVAVSLEAALAGLGVTALIASGRTEEGAAMLAAGFFAAFLLARVALYWITRRLAPDVLFLVAAIGTALSAGLAALGLQSLGFIAAGAFVGLSFPSFFVWGAQALGDGPRMSAAMLLSGLSGLALGPFVIGTVLRATGMEALFAVIAICAGALALAILAVIAPTRRAIARHAAQGPAAA